MADLKGGIDWAKLRAKTAQDHLAKLLKQKEKFTLATASAVGAGLALAAVMIVWLWIYWGLPRVGDADQLWSLNRAPSVMFLGKDGQIIGVRGPYYGKRVTLAELPAYVPQAFLAIEDRRFYQHGGVDRLGVLRAAIANARAGETVQGGSTISQQLARNLFLTRNQTLNRKLREMVLASRIERRLSKDEILELYLNRVYLGDQAYGVDAAARRFFGKPAGELNLAEAAMIAGLPKAPSRSAPTENLERAKARQRVVLEAMVTAKYITREQYEAAANAEIKVVGRVGSERYMGYVFDMAIDQAKALPGGNTPDLVIKLTIDPAIQDAAARALRTRLGNRAFGRRPMQAAFMAVDRQGDVCALIGGADYSTSKLNRVTQSLRQPGSSFKTFVYTAALEDGLDTEDVRFDEPITIDGWQPKNYDEDYRGAMTLRTAFALSINTVAAEVAHEIGPGRVAEVARRLGVSSMPTNPDAAPASIALGSVEVTLWDMTGAFSTFMDGGERVEPHLIEALYDSAGKEIYHRPLIEYRRVLDEDIVHRMNSMMGAVVIRGTGAGARFDGRDIAGKTGTSSDYRDAWFVGYSADYTAGVWVGHDDNTPMSRITGGSLPAQIWSDVMKVAHKDVEPHPLPGIEQPAASPRQVELANFFDALAQAFGDGGFGEEMGAAPPPDRPHSRRP